MNKKINVFIPSAGIGERLQPITFHIPKPLLPILGKPVLQSVLEQLSTLPVNKIGINLHHKKEAIENWINKSFFHEKITLFPEEKMLGTGGALKNAEVFLKDKTFLVHNSDVLSDINLEKLLEHHLLSKNLVTLAVHDFPKFNCLLIDNKGFLKNIIKKQAAEKPLAYTGIAVYEPEFLKFLPAGVSSVVDAWLKAVSQGYKIGTLDVSGCYWSDIGTPSAYASAVFDALRADGETVYIHPSVRGCENIGLDGYMVIEEKNMLDKGASLKNCILLPGSCIERKENEKNSPSTPLVKGGKGGLVFENCILGPDFEIDLIEAEIFELSADGRQLIGTGGSDRKYYRIRENDKSAVLMQCRNDDPDFERHIEYTKFFMRHSIPIPNLVEVEFDKKKAIFEDAGDITLYSYLKCPQKEKEIEDIYREIIDILVLIHTKVTEHVAECPLLQSRGFDYEHFRWETNYFIEQFVEGVKKMRIKNLSALNDEFHNLALKADSLPKTVIHRDFQSQNIMVIKGQNLRIIDYQGARMGPPAYDIASILWDPYYRLKDDMRERLLEYYISKVKKIPPHPPLAKGGREDYQIKENIAEKFDENYFRDTLLLCRLQRHMQALGAYGFLSSIKGKKYFLKYVAEGLGLLKDDVTFSRDEYPELYNLVIRL